MNKKYYYLLLFTFLIVINSYNILALNINYSINITKTVPDLQYWAGSGDINDTCLSSYGFSPIGNPVTTCWYYTDRWDSTNLMALNRSFLNDNNTSTCMSYNGSAQFSGLPLSFSEYNVNGNNFTLQTKDNNYTIPNMCIIDNKITITLLPQSTSTTSFNLGCKNSTSFYTLQIASNASCGYTLRYNGNSNITYFLTPSTSYINEVVDLTLNSSIGNNSITQAILFFNGSNKGIIPYEDIGNNRIFKYSTLINNTGNISYYWNVTNSDNFNFQLNSSLLVTYFNLSVTVLNEITNAKISDTAHISILYNTQVNNYSGSGGNVNITNLTGGYYQVIVDALPNYTQKSYYVNITSLGPNTLTARLTPNTQSCNSTFELRDGSNNVLNGITLTLQRSYNNQFVTVDQKTTDLTGQLIFTLINGQEYKFIASGIGYSTKEFYLSPICPHGTYQIFISETTSDIYDSVYNQVSYNYFPTNTSLKNGIYSFGLNTLSTSGTIQYTTTICNNTDVANVTSSPNGATSQIVKDLTNYNGIYTCRYIFKDNSYNEVITLVNYNIGTQYSQNISVQSMTDKAKQGFSNSWLSIIGMFIVLAITLTILQLTGGNTVASSFTAIGMIALFTALGWFNMIISVVVILIIAMTSFFKGEY